MPTVSNDADPMRDEALASNAWPFEEARKLLKRFEHAAFVGGLRP